MFSKRASCHPWGSASQTGIRTGFGRGFCDSAGPGAVGVGWGRGACIPNKLQTLLMLVLLSVHHRSSSTELGN